MKFPRPVRLTPYQNDPAGGPSLEDCLSKNFATYYLSSRVGKLFQELYTDGSRIQNAFISMWQQLATTFKDNEYVMGYELINEPWYGDTVQDPLLLLPGHGDRVNLMPLYKKV